MLLQDTHICYIQTGLPEVFYLYENFKLISNFYILSLRNFKIILLAKKRLAPLILTFRIFVEPILLPV